MLGSAIADQHGRIDGGKLPNIPARMAKPWAWTRCGVWLPSFTPALRTSDRVPRFSRFRVADNVRFVRFDMARPSHPPHTGGIEEVTRREGGATPVGAAGEGGVPSGQGDTRNTGRV